MVLSRQPGANIIQAVDGVKAELPRLAASLPGDIDLTVAVDRSKTIRQSLKDTEKTLVIAVVLVILVVFAFLRSVRAAAIPSVAVPTSIIGSFGVMYLLGFSLNNLSLMALTISTGFVVDDAIVVLENISRYLEQGMPRVEAAIKGANEVGFTVISISLSLIAVFAPLLFLGGIVGRLFTEFALTLSVAVLISMAVSLTTTPMMCALILPRGPQLQHGRLYRATEHIFDAMLNFYRYTLRIALRHPGMVALSLFATIGLNYYLFRYQMTYGLFPVQDTGLVIGSIQGDQSISFQAMKTKLAQLQGIVQDDPAVASVVGFTGGRQTNAGFVYISLKPYAERKVTADEVVTRLRGKLTQVAGARLFMVAVSDLRTGGRQSNATYQYTLLSDDTAELYIWGPKLTAALMNSDIVKDVNSDQQQGGLQTNVTIDRDTAMRLGLTSICHRQHALRRVRTAAGFDDLRSPQPISRGDGGRAALLARSAHARAALRFHLRRQSDRRAADRNRRGRLRVLNLHRNRQHRSGDRSRFGAEPRDKFARGERSFLRFVGRRGVDLARDHGSALRLRSLCAGPHAAQRQSSGTVCRGDDFLQPCVGAVPQRGEDGDRERNQTHRTCLRPSGAPSPAPRRPISNRSRACRCFSPRRWGRSISCWASSMRA